MRKQIDEVEKVGEGGEDMFLIPPDLVPAISLWSYLKATLSMSTNKPGAPSKVKCKFWGAGNFLVT